MSKGEAVFRRDQRKEPVKVTLTVTLEVYYQKIHLVIPHASEFLASCGRMPGTHEHRKHHQMDPWSPSILTPKLFIGPLCALSLSDINV